MANITDEEYYNGTGPIPSDENHGSYQFIPMIDIVNNFELMYIGNDKLVNNVPRHEVIFHVKQGIKQFNFDVFKNTKVLELTIGDTLQFIMPPDYVNFIDISYEKDGTLFPMVENKQLNYSNTYLQDTNLDIVFDVDGNVIETQSQLDISRLDGDTQQIYMGGGRYHNRPGWCVDGCWYFGYRYGGRFGYDPETMNINGTYRIDKANGVINFSSDLSGENVVLRYVSDGMEKGDDSAISVNKLAEQAIYAYVKWAILNNKRGVPMYEKNEAKKQKKAEMDNAKIRIKLNPKALIMVLRSQGKWIK